MGVRRDFFTCHRKLSQIGNRLIALFQFSKPVDTPDTYADIFKEMHRLGAVDADFLKRLVKMAKFRNRLVHLYRVLDRDTIYNFLQNNLDDFKLFEKKVVDFLNKNTL